MSHARSFIPKVKQSHLALLCCACTALLFILSACVDLDTSQLTTEERLVVHGWLSASKQRHMLTIHLLQPLGAKQRIREADGVSEVMLYEQEDGNNSYLYLPEGDGLYMMQEPMQPARGVSYYLQFIWRNERYQSSMEALEEAAIVFEPEVRQETCNEQDEPPCSYLFIAHINDDFNTRDHYRLQLSGIETSKENRQFVDHVFFDGTQNGETIEQLIGPLPFATGEQVRLSLWKVSEATYAYLQSVLPQLQEEQQGQLLLPITAPRTFTYASSGVVESRIIGHFGLIDSIGFVLSIP